MSSAYLPYKFIMGLYVSHHPIYACNRLVSSVYGVHILDNDGSEKKVKDLSHPIAVSIPIDQTKDGPGLKCKYPPTCLPAHFCELIYPKSCGYEQILAWWDPMMMNPAPIPGLGKVASS